MQSGTDARNFPQLQRMMLRSRGWKMKFALRSAQKCPEARAASYWRSGRRLFGPDKVHALSLSADATRLSGKDTLAVALYSPELKRALWAPPQAATFAAESRRSKHPFCREHLVCRT